MACPTPPHKGMVKPLRSRVSQNDEPRSDRAERGSVVLGYLGQASINVEMARTVAGRAEIRARMTRRSFGRCTFLFKETSIRRWNPRRRPGAIRALPLRLRMRLQQPILVVIGRYIRS